MSTYTAISPDVQDVDISLSIGPLFIAHCFNWCAFGVLCLQVYIYYLAFRKDALHIKCLVYGTFAIDCASMAIVTFNGWHIIVENWGYSDVLNHIGWSWVSVPVSIGITSMIVHFYFSWRIYKLSKIWWIPAFICFCSMVQGGFAFAAGYEAARVHSFRYIRKLIPSIWLGGSMLCDVMVSATLCIILYRSPRGFFLTETVIQRLIRISVETALITTVAAGIKLGLIYSWHNTVHLVFCLMFSRLYSNTLLATLNSRNPTFGGGTQSNEAQFVNPNSAGWGRLKSGLTSKNSTRKSYTSDKVLVTSQRTTDCESGFTDAVPVTLPHWSEPSPMGLSFPRAQVYPSSPTAPSYHSADIQETETPTSSASPTNHLLPKDQSTKPAITLSPPPPGLNRPNNL